MQQTVQTQEEGRALNVQAQDNHGSPMARSNLHVDATHPSQPTYIVLGVKIEQRASIQHKIASLDVKWSYSPTKEVKTTKHADRVQPKMDAMLRNEKAPTSAPYSSCHRTPC